MMTYAVIPDCKKCNLSLVSLTLSLSRLSCFLSLVYLAPLQLGRRALPPAIDVHNHCSCHIPLSFSCHCIFFAACCIIIILPSFRLRKESFCSFQHTLIIPPLSCSSNSKEVAKLYSGMRAGSTVDHDAIFIYILE